MTKEVLKEKIKETIELNKKFESISNSMFPPNDIIKEVTRGQARCYFRKPPSHCEYQGFSMVVKRRHPGSMKA